MSTQVEILYEDEFLLVANKPVDLPVHITVDPHRPHLQGLLENQSQRKLVLFHRLDVDTTGVIILGKDPKINGPMTALFHDRKIEKTYWALVEGAWNPKDTKTESFIKKVSGGKWISAPKGAKNEHALTYFKLLEKRPQHSWIEAKPHTGRTHQIRLHCRDLRHPILGDRLYGKSHPRGVPIALHAHKIHFKHPITQKELSIESPKPPHWSFLESTS